MVCELNKVALKEIKMSFLRHVGKHNDRKIAIVFRELPGEPHMCLVTYTETLNQHIHDPLIKCIESDIGQNSEMLADALNRTYAKDGRAILQVLHMEGLLKKVQTESIVVTPRPNTKIKLSELNKILTEMKQGEDAIKRLSEIDDSRGLQVPADVARRMREGRDATVPPIAAAADGVLGDNSIATNLRAQAAKMAAEAKGLLAESDRLIQQATAMDPPPAAPKAKAPRAKKTKVIA